MRNLCCVLFFLTLSLFTNSQAICGFDEVHSIKLRSDPVYKKSVEENEQQLRTYISKNRNRLSARTEGNSVLYTIPVVVHVMHTGGAIGTIYNPTDGQIQGAINYLNQVYRGTYPGTQGIGDLQIQFALAVKDPNCNSTTGIERIDASSISGYSTNGISMNVGTTPGVNELSIKNLSRWNPSQYYNIWVVNKIDGKDGTSGTFTAGYAYFPGAPPTYDGIIMLATQMVSGQKTLPHEMAHAFGLYHTFEGSSDVNTCPANTGDCSIDGDRVCDTDPESLNLSNGVYDFSCRTGMNSCTNANYSSNTESNYMNYTNCYTLFTAGQKARLLANAAGPYRIGLSTSLALNSTYPIASYTSPIAPSCSPVTSATGLSHTSAGILNVSVNNKNIGSSLSAYDNGYVDGTASCLNLIQLVNGMNYTFTATLSGINQEQVRAWIDYNNDGIFDNTTEQILFNSFVSVSSPTVSASFVVPSTAILNTMLRMRVIDDVSTNYAGISSISNGCFNPTYGQAEDYPVFITSGTLPVTLTNFTGNLKNNSVALFWNTSAEQDLKNFEIEKSINGRDFKFIATVLAGAASHNYSYIDNDVAANNYYRLRMNDINGENRLSNVVLVHYNGNQQKVWIINNPFNNYIELGFNKAGSQVLLQLMNELGAVVAEKTIASPAGQIKWNLPSTLSNGNYVVKAIVDNEMFTYKMIKQ